MASPVYTVEHFYYGQLVTSGRPAGDPRLLAASPGVRQDQVVEAMQIARLPALPGPGAFALLHGSSTPFFLVQSVTTTGQHAMRHFIIPPTDTLRGLAGNLKALLGLLQPVMPLFEMTGQRLAPLTLPQVGAAAPALQESAMLDLMTFTRDRLDVIEKLLAAVVQGASIVIARAPADLNRRIALVEGLLALLPPPARYGITFASHAEPESKLNAQIRFVEDVPSTLSPDAVSYVWNDTKVTGAVVRDEYSSFIVSQLRLDTGLVVEQTRVLTPVAGWRIRRGDPLSVALAYASYRLKVDNAVANHLPAEARDVAAVLTEDPTLSEQLRFAYIRHLLAFALALDDDEHADLLLKLAHSQPDLERTLLDELNAAIIEGKGDQVLNRVSLWVSRPDGFTGMYWNDLLMRAAVANAEILAKAGDANRLDAFLHQLRDTPHAEDFAPLMPRLVEISYPLAVTNRTLAQTVFALAASFVPADRLQRLLSAKPLLAQLPPQMSELMSYATLENRSQPPHGLLMQVLSSFDASWRPLLAVRLTEMVLLAGRLDLIDGDVLTALYGSACSEWGEAYNGSLRWIVNALSADDVLPAFDVRSRNVLLRILLVRRAYRELIGELQRQNRLFYPAERQLQFAGVVYDLFFDTALAHDHLNEALRELAGVGLKALPLAMAYFGALRRNQWPDAMSWHASELTDLLVPHRLVSEAIPVDMLAELLAFHVRRHDTVQSARVASLLPAAVARRGEQGAAMLVEVYRSLTWDADVRAAGLDTLRSYVRRLPDQATPRAIALLGRELGTDVAQALEATALVRQVMGGQELGELAHSLHVTALFLHDTGLTYSDRNRIPILTVITSDLDSLRGGLSSQERAALANAIMELARMIAVVAGQHRKLHPRESDAQVEQLLTGNGTVSSAVDMFRALGGFFARGRRLDMQEKVLPQHPLGGRPAHELLKEIEITTRTLGTALKAMPTDRRISVPARAIQGEAESLWAILSVNERRTLEHDLAEDLQSIAEWTLAITEKMDPKVLQDGSSQARKLASLVNRPENTIEFYRFMSGYFGRR